MSLVRHRAIVVTSWNEVELMKAKEESDRLTLLSTSVTMGSINGYGSFLVCPSGSKSGWDEDEKHENSFESLKEYLMSRRYEDNSSSLEWVEICYGCDISDAMITDSEWE